MTFANIKDMLPTDLQRFNYVALEEPWVTAQIPSDCSAALAHYFKTVHESTSDVMAQDRAAEKISVDCAIGQGRYGWTPNSYRKAVSAVEKAEGVTLVAGVGISFGRSRRAPVIAWHKTLRRCRQARTLLNMISKELQWPGWTESRSVQTRA